MPLANYLPVRDNNAAVAPGNIRTDESKTQQIINSIRQIMADLAAVFNVSPVVLPGALTVTTDLLVGGNLGVTGNTALTGSLTIGANLTPIGAPGSVVDSVVGNYTTNAAITGAGNIIPVDDTIPLVTEGLQIISVALTPKSVANKLRCRFSAQGTGAAAANLTYAIFVGSTCIDTSIAQNTAADVPATMASEAEFSPASVAAQTIQVRVGIQIAAASIRLNGTSTARLFGGSSSATLTVEEIKV